MFYYNIFPSIFVPNLIYSTAFVYFRVSLSFLYARILNHGNVASQCTYYSLNISISTNYI